MNLKELSEHLKLSQTTVSRALNGYPEVSESTRQRVQEAARLHGYQPSARARSLAMGKAMAIGHVLPISREHELVNPVFGDFIAGAGHAYAAGGYRLVLSLVDDDEELQTYRDIAASGTVDGLILHGPRIEDPRIELLLELGMPFVVHGRASNATQAYSWLDVNNRRAMRLLTEHVIEHGHRRIALFNGLRDFDYAKRREVGYREAHEAANIEVDDALITNGMMTEPYGYLRASEMLDSPTPPTAILTSSSIVALGVRRACEQRGLVVGRDMTLATYDDDISYLRDTSGETAITCVRSSVHEHGRRAAEMLLSQIRSKAKEPPICQLEASFIQGQSVGQCP